MTGILVVGGFLAFVLLVVMLDLGVFHRHAHAVRLREALAWTVVWVLLALAFNVFVYFLYAHNLFGWFENSPFCELRALYAGEPPGPAAAVDFLTGYVIELSLSLDNIFVIALILGYFHVPLAQQHRVLFWGILGAVVLRGVMIGIGATLVSHYHWVLYIFGAFLVITALRMLVARHDKFNPERNLVVRLTRLVFPVTPKLHESRFFVRVNGRLAATPLFLALVLVESSDVIFAVDSIPAIFGVTEDPFLVFTSNIFAILGLRSMYFLLAGLIDRFRYLKTSLAIVLGYVGVKMLLPWWWPGYKTSNLQSLAVIGAVLVLGVLVSLMAPRRQPAPPGGTPPTR